MKICILKPIVWNNNNYKFPSGYKSNAKYIKDNGYGHEEWNNNPNWIWRNYRVFHTEPINTLKEYSETGNLSILMISSYNKKQYAVGIATSVYHNYQDEQKNIGEYLKKYSPEIEAWKTDSVRKCFKDSSTFIKHWKKSYSWISWKCPINQYYWFPNPIVLKAKEITGKKNLIREFSSYQRTSPEIIIKIIKDHIKNCPEIGEWLTSGEFDLTFLKNEKRKDDNEKIRKKYGIKSNSTSKTAYSYAVEGQRYVEPMHDRLQMRYIDYLSGKSVKNISEIRENENNIDIKYKKKGTQVFVEVKPTDKCEPKYAIRAAIGQLLEYQYKNDKNAKLEIVISSKPNVDNVNFVKSLNIGLVYYMKSKKVFKIVYSPN